MAPISQAENIDTTRRKVASAVSLFEHREGSKQVDIKDIGALVSIIRLNIYHLVHANQCHAESLESDRLLLAAGSVAGRES